jgi:hypothetical protein
VLNKLNSFKAPVDRKILSDSTVESRPSAKWVQYYLDEYHLLVKINKEFI